MRKILWILITVLLVSWLCGCASMNSTTKQRQVASLLAYLFPNSEQIEPQPDMVAEIKVPFKIGVAFVPDHNNADFRLPETDRLILAGKVRDAFAKYPFIREIVAVPSMYLESGGGFENLDQIAALLKLDVVALVSFDQVQNAGPTGWSFLYWTGLGAYIISGDQYDILTAVETAVFDVKSRRLLMRASGVSNIKGTATMVGFSERARRARTGGFEEAMGGMIGNLHEEVKLFRERAPKDPSIALVLPPGYNPNATNTSQK